MLLFLLNLEILIVVIGCFIDSEIGVDVFDFLFFICYNIIWCFFVVVDNKYFLFGVKYKVFIGVCRWVSGLLISYYDYVFIIF